MPPQSLDWKPRRRKACRGPGGFRPRACAGESQGRPLPIQTRQSEETGVKKRITDGTTMPGVNRPRGAGN